MKPANCPCCGGAMKTGRLSRMNEVWWDPDGAKRESLRSYLSWEGLKKLCVDATVGCIEIPTEEGWFPVIDEVPAYHCPGCQIFLFVGREGRE